MKRESNTRRTLATAVAILLLLTVTPLYGRAQKQRTQDPYYGQSTIERLVLWVQSRIVPPWPEPEPGTPDNGDTTDTVTTDTTDTTETTLTSTTT